LATFGRAALRLFEPHWELNLKPFQWPAVEYYDAEIRRAGDQESCRTRLEACPNYRYQRYAGQPNAGSGWR
jgi:hypothetical protein